MAQIMADEGIPNTISQISLPCLFVNCVEETYAHKPELISTTGAIGSKGVKQTIALMQVA
jgi:hypothetical protein